jgi:hypothetical protein
LRTL